MRMIPVVAFQARHPEGVVSPTDKDYTRLAEKIYDYMLTVKSVFTEEEMLNASITLALYFEDIHSGLHQFEAFTHLYSQMYGRYLPFFDARTKSECQDQEELQFVFWLAFAAERGGRVLNPLNEGIHQMVLGIAAIWEENKHKIAPNEELLDYLYCEETQEDALQIKNVLIWLSHNSLLGRFFTNPNLDQDPYGVKAYFKGASKSQLTYAFQSVSCLVEPCGPLSLPAQLWYAEMIRLEMEDPDDEVASAIEAMKGTEVSLHKIVGSDKRYIQLEDFKGDTFKVLRNSFDGGDLKARPDCHYLASGLLSFRGEWHACGLCSVTDVLGAEYDDYCQKQQNYYDIFHSCEGQYEEYIQEHGGNRFRFFGNKDELLQFLKKELGIKNVESVVPISKMHSHIMMYFEENGQMTFSFRPECVCHPDNPYYDVDEADAEALSFVVDRSWCCPDCLMYLIRNHYLSDARLNDFKGVEHGRHLAQDNMEFMARCMRRDIKSSEVFFRRDETQNPLPEELTAEIVRGLSLKEFAQCLSREKSFRSKANKEWRLSHCSEVETIVVDVNNRKSFHIPTQALKDASEQLAKDEFMVASLVPYVGKVCAPAASAVLYNVMGKGSTMHKARKNLNNLFDLLRMKETIDSQLDRY